MPWFLTSILSKRAQRESVNYKDRRERIYRTFGFYNTYADAYKAVFENRCDMHECLYDLLVMEYIEEGIHPQVHTTQWWKWNDIENKWEFLSIEDNPVDAIGTCNWALG